MKTGNLPKAVNVATTVIKVLKALLYVFGNRKRKKQCEPGEVVETITEA